MPHNEKDNTPDPKLTDNIATLSGAPESNHTNLYVEKKADDLYFVMERVDSSNIDFWRNFVAAQFKVKLRNNKQSSKIGLSGFKASLDQFTRLSQGNGELWIAYASYEPVTRRNTNADLKEDESLGSYEKKYEMIMTILSNPHSSFTTHMGITRSRSSIKADMPQHQRLSVPLHSFAANFMRERDNSRTFMITVPIEEMREIFLKTLPVGKVWYGDNEYIRWMGERLEFLRTRKENDAIKKEMNNLQNALNDSKHNGSPLTILHDGTIVLKKKDGTEIQKIDRSDPNYVWFYNHRTLTVLNSHAGWPYNPEDLTEYMTVDLEYLATCSQSMKFELATRKSTSPSVSTTPSTTKTAANPAPNSGPLSDAPHTRFYKQAEQKENVGQSPSPPQNTQSPRNKTE